MGNILQDHEILSVPIGASKEDIKRAYRSIAQTYHPDKNKSPNAPSIFSRATKAYDNLMAIKDTHPILQSRKSKKGQDIKVSINVTTEDIVKGSKKRISTNRKGKCSTCDGTGSAKKKTKACSYCSGTGFQGMALVMGQKKACLFCNGSEVTPDGTLCNSCSGTGLEIEVINKDIILEPLSERFLFHGYGNYCLNGDYGNLIVEIHVERHPHFTIHGLNIIGSLTISPAQAIIGDKVHREIFGVREEITIPPGTQNGDVIEKVNAGIKKQGWLKMKVKITTPSIISKEERILYEKILKIEKE